MNKWLELKLEEKPRIFMFFLATLLGIFYLVQKHFAQVIPSFPLEVFPQLVYGAGFWVCVFAFALLLFLKQGPDAFPIAIGFFTITIMETLTVITFIAWSYVYPWLGIVGSIVLGTILAMKKPSIRMSIIGVTMLTIGLIMILTEMSERWSNFVFAVGAFLTSFPIIRNDAMRMSLKNLVITIFGWILFLAGIIYFLTFISTFLRGYSL